jgi:hypothetical protein
MSEPRAGIPWSRVAIEGVVIVVSILLAFGIDAWWDGQQSRRSERALMVSLVGDLEQARAGADTALSRNTRTAAALDEFMAADPAVLARLSEDSAQGMLDRLLRFDTYAASGGALRSGAVGDLSSQELREALATWSALEADVTERAAIMLDLLKEVRLSVTPETLRALGDVGVDPNITGAPGSLAWMRETDEVVVALLTLDSFAAAFRNQLQALSAQTDSALAQLRMLRQ